MYKENSFLRREFRSKQVYFILVLRRVLLVYDSIGTESTTIRGDREIVSSTILNRYNTLAGPIIICHVTTF